MSIRPERSSPIYFYAFIAISIFTRTNSWYGIGPFPMTSLQPNEPFLVVEGNPSLVLYT
jgi:hypothetical protein